MRGGGGPSSAEGKVGGLGARGRASSLLPPALSNIHASHRNCLKIPLLKREVQKEQSGPITFTGWVWERLALGLAWPAGLCLPELVAGTAGALSVHDMRDPCLLLWGRHGLASSIRKKNLG